MKEIKITYDERFCELFLGAMVAAKVEKKPVPIVAQSRDRREIYDHLRELALHLGDIRVFEAAELGWHLEDKGTPKESLIAITDLDDPGWIVKFLTRYLSFDENCAHPNPSCVVVRGSKAWAGSEFITAALPYLHIPRHEDKSRASEESGLLDTEELASRCQHVKKILSDGVLEAADPAALGTSSLARFVARVNETALSSSHPERHALSLHDVDVQKYHSMLNRLAVGLTIAQCRQTKELLEHVALCSLDPFRLRAILELIKPEVKTESVLNRYLGSYTGSSPFSLLEELGLAEHDGRDKWWASPEHKKLFDFVARAANRLDQRATPVVRTA